MPKPTPDPQSLTMVVLDESKELRDMLTTFVTVDGRQYEVAFMDGPAVWYFRPEHCPVWLDLLGDEISPSFAHDVEATLEEDMRDPDWCL